MPRERRPSRPSNPYDWLVEPLTADASYIERSMFGCRASYFRGRMVLVAARSGDEPWNGFLVPTDRSHHESLIASLPALSSHPVLGKWLYLPESRDLFEQTARALVRMIATDDRRVGIEPQLKRRRRPSRTKRPAKE